MASRAEHRGRLAEVIAPRGLEGSIRAARGMLTTLAGQELTLEIAVSSSAVRCYVRGVDDRALERALAALRAAYPHADVEHVPDGRQDLDPAAVLGDEKMRALAVGQRAEPVLPLRADWRGEADPLAGILAPGPLNEGERFLLRLTLGPPPARAADRVRARVEPRRTPRPNDPTAAPAGALPLVAALGVGAGALQAWRWYQAEEWAALAAASAPPNGAAASTGRPAASPSCSRPGRRPRSGTCPRTVPSRAPGARALAG
jgi:hypothetical protein